ncbi:hypothetical protein CEXT_422251 [Caerostris extrusa]|uniref:Uncharacterized protein n=1 Tax=Caerostris extrusa TaxID=172846 RepID=A0AAV4U9F9_CAEEX|nr:hypothetical protein CEXT_422251 [Caerostris extrusa]
MISISLECYASRCVTRSETSTHHMLVLTMSGRCFMPWNQIVPFGVIQQHRRNSVPDKIRTLVDSMTNKRTKRVLRRHGSNRRCCSGNQGNEDHAPLKRVSYFRKLRTRPTDSDNTGTRDESTEKRGFATVIKYADDILTEGNRVQARINDKRRCGGRRKKKEAKKLERVNPEQIQEIHPAGCCPGNQGNEDHAPLKRVSYFRKLRTRPIDSDNTGTRDESTKKWGFVSRKSVIKYSDDILASHLFGEISDFYGIFLGISSLPGRCSQRADQGRFLLVSF